MARACARHGLVAGDGEFCPVCGARTKESTPPKTTSSSAGWIVGGIVVLALLGVMITRGQRGGSGATPATDTEPTVPNVENKPVRRVQTPEERLQETLNKLPTDKEYYVVSGEAMNSVIQRLSGQLIRIDAIMMEYGPDAHILNPECMKSKFESRDRKFAFTALWGDWNKGTHKEPKNRLKKLGGDKRGSKVRLWGRWHYEKGFLRDARYLDVDRFEVVDWQGGWHASDPEPSPSDSRPKTYTLRMASGHRRPARRSPKPCRVRLLTQRYDVAL